MIRWEEKKLNRKGSRPIAVFGTLVIILLIFVGFGYLLILFINRRFENVELNNLVDLSKIYASQITDVWNSISAWLEKNNVDIGQVSGSFSGLVNSVTSAATDLTFAFMFAIYFLLDWDDISAYWDRVLNVFFKSETRKKVREILKDADRCFSGYIRGTFVDSLILGGVTTVVMLLCGVPDFYFVGWLTGIGKLIPYFGPILGYAALIIACIVNNATNKLIIGAIAMIILITIDSNIISPKLLSSHINIHPILILTAIIAGSAVGGLTGLLIAVPTAAFLKTEFDKYIDWKEAQKQIE